MLIQSSNITNKPIISIMVMAYNHKDFLRQCLDSILSQNISVPYELVLCEDCSVDGTQEICKEYQTRYPEIIRLNLNEINIGLIKNYRKALSLCRGKYIAQLAGDDFWYDINKLQIQLDALEAHPECDLCYTNCYTCNKIGEIDMAPLLKEENITFENQLMMIISYWAPGSWMFRRCVLEYLDLQDWFTDESFAIALDILHHSKVLFLNAPTFVYRILPNSAARQIDPQRKWEYVYGLFRMQLYYADKYGMSKEFITKLQLQEYFRKCLAAIDAGDEQFVDEGRCFCEKHGVNISWFIEWCREYIKYKNQYEKIRASKAYCLGKILTAPFGLIRRKICGK